MTLQQRSNAYQKQAISTGRHQSHFFTDNKTSPINIKIGTQADLGLTINQQFFPINISQLKVPSDGHINSSRDLAA
jgi:hypothetical protein